MPRGNKTGPNGEGPMTGRGMGYCSGNDKPGYSEPGVGFRGGGRFRATDRGFGRNSGRGFGQYADVNPRGQPRPRDGRGRNFQYRETEQPENTLNKISETLEDMKKRLDNLEK